MKKLFVLIAVTAVMISYCGKKPQIILPASQQFTKAKGLYDKGKYYKAQLEFENLIYTYPGNTVIDTAQYYMGMCYYEDKDYGLAIGELKRLLTIYPGSELADDAQFYVAMSHYKMSPKYTLDQNETYRAIEEFSSLIANYPVSEFRDDSRTNLKELENKLAQKSYKAAELYLKLNDYKSALVYFAYVRDNFSSTDWAIRSFFYSGVAQFELNKTDEAKDIFEKFLQGFSDHELALEAKSMLDKVNKKVNSKEG